SNFTLELNDGGTVTINAATISAAAPGQTLENNGNTISGIGQIGDGIDGNLMLDNNAGTIEAIGGTLMIDTGNAVTNADTFLAYGGKLDIADAVTGSGSAIIENGGTLELGAADA